ncbi:hypothetical protein BH24GEM2_BH24GEM2_04500 [soil metagenome]
MVVAAPEAVPEEVVEPVAVGPVEVGPVEAAARVVEWAAAALPVAVEGAATHTAAGLEGKLAAPR